MISQLRMRELELRTKKLHISGNRGEEISQTRCKRKYQSKSHGPNDKVRCYLYNKKMAFQKGVSGEG